MNTYDKERHTKDLTFVHVHILISDIFSTNFLNECKILSMTYFMYSELSNIWRAFFNQKIRQITAKRKLKLNYFKKQQKLVLTFPYLR